MINKTKAFSLLKATSCIVLMISVILYFVSVEIAGASAISLLCYVVLLFLSLPFCGFYLLSKAIDIKDNFTALVCSVPLGVIILLISYIALHSFNLPFLCIIPSLILGLFGVRSFYYKTRKTPFKLEFHHCILILTFSLFLLIYILIGVLSFAKVSQVGTFFYHQDMLFSVGNAASVYNGFPFEDMRLANTTLNYHFLNDVTSGILGYVIGITGYEALCFYYYPSMMALLILAIYKFSNLLCKNKIICAVSAFILLFVNNINSIVLFDYFLNMNGQGSSTLIGIAFMILFYYIYKQNKIKPINFILIFIYAIPLTLFKSTISGIILAALLSAGIVHFLIHKKNYSAIIYSLSAFAGFLFVYLSVFSSAVNNLLFMGIERIIPGLTSAFLASPLVFIAFVICGFIALFHIKKISFLNLACYAAAFGGILAFCLYEHYSASENYFFFIALPFMIFAVIQFISNICVKNKFFTIVLICVSLVFCILSMDTLAFYSSNGVRALMNIYDIVEDPYDESYITTYDEQAMDYLRENTQQDAIFATNRNNKFKDSGDGIFHYYTAISQRRAYIESYRYTMDYSGMYEEVRRRLEQVSDEIFYNLSETEAFSLAQKEGIDYLVVKKTIHDPLWEDNLVYENEEVSIYKVNTD